MAGAIAGILPFAVHFVINQFNSARLLRWLAICDFTLAFVAMASLAMILGPLFGGVVYTQWGHFEAYGSGALIIVLAIVSVVVAVPALRRHKAEMEAAV